MKQSHDQPADALRAVGSPASSAAELRRRAEERLTEKRKSQRSDAGDQRTAEDTARLVHELRVHQIELEMLLGVAVYAGRLGYATYTTHGVENEVASLGPTYTNAIQLRDRYRVLKDRQELKYAGLDCWNTTARLLPEEATLDNMIFMEGKRLKLDGTAPADQAQRLYDFEREMRKTTINGQPLFDSSKGENLQWRAQGPNAATASWTLNLELKRSEVQ